MSTLPPDPVDDEPIPGLIVTPAGESAEGIVGLVIRPDDDGADVLWLSTMRGTFVCWESWGDLTVHRISAHERNADWIDPARVADLLEAGGL